VSATDAGISFLISFAGLPVTFLISSITLPCAAWRVNTSDSYLLATSSVTCHLMNAIQLLLIVSFMLVGVCWGGDRDRSKLPGKVRIVT